MDKFNLPEWLTFSTLTATASAIIGIIILFVKLSSSVKSSKILGKAQLNLLDTMANKLSDMRAVVNELEAIRSDLLLQSTKVTLFVSDTNRQIENLALFTNECFQYTDLEENKKVRIKLKMDELFLSGKQAIIDNLVSDNVEIKGELTTATSEILKLENDLQQAKERIPTKQTKTRGRP